MGGGAGEPVYRAGMCGESGRYLERLLHELRTVIVDAQCPRAAERIGEVHLHFFIHDDLGPVVFDVRAPVTPSGESRSGHGLWEFKLRGARAYAVARGPAEAVTAILGQALAELQHRRTGAEPPQGPDADAAPGTRRRRPRPGPSGQSRPRRGGT